MRGNAVAATLLVASIVAAAAMAMAKPTVTADVMTAARKEQVVDRLAAEVDRRYVEFDKVPAIQAALSAIAKSRELENAASPEAVAKLLGDELRRFDHHFAVQWRAPSGNSLAPAGESWFAKLDRQNSGFKRVEILEGNIGYIELLGFDGVNERSTARVAEAMAKVANTDVLIFDLRQNGGGSGDMVRLISSYLLSGGIHLNSFYWRSSDSTTEFWTLDRVAGEKRLGVPVYVLTSKDTFSAAEEFAYNLKHLGRAKIVGETTKGGANPWQFFELGNGFRAGIPIAKAINPVTLGNWERVGVQPDHPVPADDAFDVAYRSALATHR